MLRKTRVAWEHLDALLRLFPTNLPQMARVCLQLGIPVSAPLGPSFAAPGLAAERLAEPLTVSWKGSLGHSGSGTGQKKRERRT